MFARLTSRGCSWHQTHCRERDRSPQRRADSDRAPTSAITGDRPVNEIGDAVNPFGTKTVIAPPQTTGWDEVYPFSVTWTPDGTHLVYLGWRGGFDEAVLVAVPIDVSQSPILLGEGIDVRRYPVAVIQMMSGTGPFT